MDKTHDQDLKIRTFLVLALSKGSIIYVEVRKT